MGAALLALAGLGAGFLRPVAATRALAAATPLLPGLARLWGDGSGPPLLETVALATLGGILAGRRRRGEASSLPAPVRSWGGAFLVVAAVSAATSALRGESLYFLLRGGADPVLQNALGMTAASRWRAALEALAVLAVLVAGLDAFRASAREEGESVRLVVAAAAGAIPAFALTLLEAQLPFWLTQPGWRRIARLSGTFSDPNALGIGTALLVPLLATVLVGPASRVARSVAGAALLLAVPVLESSGSRTGLLVLLVGALVAGAGLLRAGRSTRRALAAGAVLLGLLLALVAAFWAVAPRARGIADGGLVKRIGATLSARSAWDASNSRRLFWGGAVAMVAAEPLSGCGLAGFPFEFPYRYEREAGAKAVTDNATNAILDVAAECGLPALVLALAGVVPILVAALEAALSKEVAAGSLLPRAAGATLAAFAVSSMTGSHLKFPEVALLAVLAAALLPFPGPAVEPAFGLSLPRRVRPLLVFCGVLASLLATLKTLDAGAAFRGNDWAGAYGSETLGGHAGRHWLSETAFRQIRKDERALSLTLENARPDGRAVLAEFQLDGLPLGRFSIPAAESRAYRVEGIPRGAGALRIGFSPSFVPARLTGGRDTRRLSVILVVASGEGAP